MNHEHPFRRWRGLPRARTIRALAAASLLAAAVMPRTAVAAGEADRLDTALIVSVDVSNSVDEHRYKLQMEGIAAALEDPAVINAILNGPQGGILFNMITWADRPQVAIGWTRISSRADAMALAQKVRKLPKQGGEFTCVARMMRFVADKVMTQVPVKTARVVLDVSGDGRENCNPEQPVAEVRDEIVAAGATVNGLPILEGREADVLEPWYREHVMGGPGAFVTPAEGFGDFGRAIRQKFVVEISVLARGSAGGIE